MSPHIDKLFKDDNGMTSHVGVYRDKLVKDDNGMTNHVGVLIVLVKYGSRENTEKKLF